MAEDMDIVSEKSDIMHEQISLFPLNIVSFSAMANVILPTKFLSACIQAFLEIAAC